jgi:nucleoid DNA-binding protein
VNFTGFGKFSVAERGPRQGVNPRTGERITIAGGKVPKFSAGAGLKTKVKGG